MKSVVGSRSTPQVTFVGPFGVGKTTAVFTLCGASVSSTEVNSSLATARRGRRVKPTTTVGLEMGEWVAPDGQRVTVVGTPSQERFDLVRQSAMPRSSAVVLWLFGDHVQAELDAELWLDFMAGEVQPAKITVALTRLGGETDGQLRFHAIRGVVERVAPGTPVLVGDPRNHDDVARIVTESLHPHGMLPRREPKSKAS